MKLSLSPQQKIAWLRLARSERIGANTFSNLINRYGSAEAALEALPEINARTGGKSPPRITTGEEAEAELEEAAKLGIQHIAYGESQYPAPLRNIDDKPAFLLVQGSLECLNKPTIAIIGSRNASIAGQKMAGILAKDLGERGYVVVSGLARGIDTAAHKASLQTGTIAVIAGGHQKPYPPENQDLHRQIAASSGAVVSEMPPRFTARGIDFPRRNRIISGLSRAVVVVEAARRSGSLITARLAAEQGRQVFAVPGSPLDPRAEGANKLLREDGATLVRNADDIELDLRPSLGEDAPEPLADQTPFRMEMEPAELDWDSHEEKQTIQEKILRALSPTPVPVDDVIRYLDLPTGLILSALSDLEISGFIVRGERNSVSLQEN